MVPAWLRVALLWALLVGTVVVAGGQPISEPTMCVKAAYSEQQVEFTFFRTAPSGAEEEASVTIFGLTPEDPTLFRWGVRAKDYGSAHRIRYGVVPKDFVRTTPWNGDPPLKNGARYRLFAGGHGMATVWFIPGVTPVGVCIPEWER